MSNSTLLILVGMGAALVGVLATMLVVVLRKKPSDDQGLLMLQRQMEEVRTAVDERLGESAKASREQFTESVKVVRDITEKLTHLERTNKEVVEFTDHLRELEEILKNPKRRGIMGEYYLENVLKNVLPPSNYQMQYKFPDGEIADAVIFVKDKIIPIDSKFSLENYNRLAEERDPATREELEKKFKEDLKDRIDETAKYIKPDHGTMDFAFMFIPAEGVYYDLLVNQVGTMKSNTRDLLEYAQRDKKVIIVSPTSFFAYLQTVLQGLRALRIEESAKEIRKRVEDLSRHLGAYGDHMRKLGATLGTAVNSYNTATKEFGKIDKDVVKITGFSASPDIPLIEKPGE